MNDEIKEILDYFRKYATIRENTMISEIEDYITNLQKEKEDYKSRVEKASEDIKDIFKDEKWYENYEYNDLENALKNVLNILQNGSDGK